MRKNREEPDRPQGNEAARDDLGGDPRQVGPESAGPSGDPQRLSTIEDADNESTDELADTDQALEAGPVEGVEDAAEHPERPVHTHNEYGPPPREFRIGRRPRKKAQKERLAGNCLIGCFLKQFFEGWFVLLRICLFSSLVGHDPLSRRPADPLPGQGLYGLDCRELLSFLLPCHTRECHPRLVT